MSDSHMHEAHACSAEAEASFSAPSNAAAPDFLRFEPPAELIGTAHLVSSSLGSSRRGSNSNDRTRRAGPQSLGSVTPRWPIYLPARSA